MYVAWRESQFICASNAVREYTIQDVREYLIVLHEREKGPPVGPMPADAEQVFTGGVHGNNAKTAIDDDRRGKKRIEDVVCEPAGAGR